MSTRIFISHVARLAVSGAIFISAAGCGGELLRTGRSPVYLVVTGVTAQQGGTGSNASVLLSDVNTGGSVINDNATVSLRVDRKDPAVAATTMNAVTLTRYRVTFRRTDGRSTPGVDVPYGFDGALNATINAGSTASVNFELVRHQMKLEPPLKNLVASVQSGVLSGGGLVFISTIAEITIWGRDQNGNELTVTTSIDVHFADFADA